MTERGRERNQASFSWGHVPARAGGFWGTGLPGASRGSDAGKQRAAFSPATSVQSLQLRVNPEDKPETVSGGASFSVTTSSAGDAP